MTEINLKYYKNQDNNTYFPLNNLNEDLIELLKNPENDIKVRDTRPEIYYYLLSPHNEDLYGWFEIEPDSEVLEIHSGLGAGTKTLSKKAKSVVSVNFSKVNAEIIASRLSDRDNVELIVGNIKDIDYGKKFDYVVIEDIMEFSRAFFSEADFIKFFKNLLKDDGTMILTTTNRFGAGNFAGAINHITAKAYDFLNDFSEVNFLKGFSKSELQKIFTEAGFDDIDFYYPTPNHYMNAYILSDKSIHKAKSRKVCSKFANYVINQNQTFDEIRFMHDIADENMFPFFANSYMIFATNAKKERAHYAQFKRGILTTLDENCCKKSAQNPIQQEALNKMAEFYETETKRLKENNIQNIKYAKCTKCDNYITFEKAIGTPMNEIALKSLDNENKLLAILMEYKNLVYKIYPSAQYQDFSVENIVLANVACAKNVNYDMNLSNIFKDDENYTITDYDRIAEVLPLNYIIAHALFILNIDSNFVFDEIKYLKLLGLSEREIAIYQAIYAKNLNG